MQIEEHWFQWLLGIFMTAGAWFVKRLRDDVDALKANSVTREELQKFEERSSAERQQMHVENRGMLERIHERVDAVWTRLAQ